MHVFLGFGTITVLWVKIPVILPIVELGIDEYALWVAKVLDVTSVDVIVGCNNGSTSEKSLFSMLEKSKIINQTFVTLTKIDSVQTHINIHMFHSCLYFSLFPLLGLR